MENCIVGWLKICFISRWTW